MIGRLAPFFACLALPALAEVPVVVADIGPVHSMVARVMDGVGTPVLMIPAGVSPHGHAMRPSEAAALTRADLVVWVGAALAPWMERVVETLAEDARSLELLEDVGVAPSPKALQAENMEAEPGDHPGDDHGHAEHEEHAEADHSGEDHGHADDHGHDHGGIDPHAWLDPATGKLWLDRIAEVLTELDPENEIIYAANADAGKAELDSLMMEIRARMVPLQGRGYITFHDAYSGFEERFDIPSLGAISVSDAAPASAGQVASLREVVVASQAVCVFAEPQFDPGLVKTLTEGTSARSGVLDPLGATLQPGIDLYPTLLRNLSISLEDCLTP
ncbi:zinc transport system substrate-binding protein [Jannaschia faecimaris]|uniref:High-affinity zinc uptake system protein ZnuA n=1 Tax=Jannaschia faecimaris TaxID=1244108 RepID=A0A1H3U568_9RHOB|nr:zinc ABC transporter substrate-binding protein [Jannaschia faecimaris]SDZ56669.1 zinc transport system substrate-binding protein [Jannaschia faecimaris]